MENEVTTELSARLRAAMTQAQLTQTALAKKAGVSQPTIAFILSGRNKTTNSEILANIASALGVSIAWLLGQASDPEPSNEGSSSIVKYFSSAPRKDSSGRLFFDATERFYTFPNSIFKDNGCKPEDCMLFEVNTDTMEPAIFRGDSVLVCTTDTSPWAHPVPHVYAVVSGDLLKFYRLIPTIDGITVASSNPSYPSASFTKDQFESNFFIIGRVITKFGTGGL